MQVNHAPEKVQVFDSTSTLNAENFQFSPLIPWDLIPGEIRVLGYGEQLTLINKEGESERIIKGQKNFPAHTLWLGIRPTGETEREANLALYFQAPHKDQRREKPDFVQAIIDGEIFHSISLEALIPQSNQVTSERRRIARLDYQIAQYYNPSFMVFPKAFDLYPDKLKLFPENFKLMFSDEELVKNFTDDLLWVQLIFPESYSLGHEIPTIRMNAVPIINRFHGLVGPFRPKSGKSLFGIQEVEIKDKQTQFLGIDRVWTSQPEEGRDYEFRENLLMPFGQCAAGHFAIELAKDRNESLFYIDEALDHLRYLLTQFRSSSEDFEAGSLKSSIHQTREVIQEFRNQHPDQQEEKTAFIHLHFRNQTELIHVRVWLSNRYVNLSKEAIFSSMKGDYPTLQLIGKLTESRKVPDFSAQVRLIKEHLMTFLPYPLP